MSDSFQTINDGPWVEIKERGSRFRGIAFHCTTEASANERLSELRKRYHDATHHCSAWRVGSKAALIERFDDDGEPNGTAGRPILTAIQREELRETAVIIVRYYGGTKLGSGGLSRAYGQTAALALDSAIRRTVWHEVSLEFECSWNDVGLIEATLGQLENHIRSCERIFAEVAVFRVTVLESFQGQLKRTIEEATGNRARVK